jgi:hypothetical protein
MASFAAGGRHTISSTGATSGATLGGYMDDKLTAPKRRSRKFVAVATGIGAAYVCQELRLAIADPADTTRDMAPAFAVAAMTSAPTGTGLVLNAVTEAEYRVDMPWLKVFMAAKPSG